MGEIVRRPNPDRGQGHYKATHTITDVDDNGVEYVVREWEYEHDETDKQIHAIEELITSVRDESGASTDNDGTDDDGHPLRGALFSWNVDSDGDVVISTSFTKPSEGSVVSHRGVTLENTAWASHVWVIGKDGTVVGPREV